MVIWPDLKNQALSEVKPILEEYNIDIKTNIMPQPDQAYYIYDQQPKAGSIVDLAKQNITTYLYIKAEKD